VATLVFGPLAGMFVPRSRGYMDSWTALTCCALRNSETRVCSGDIRLERGEISNPRVFFAASAVRVARSRAHVVLTPFLAALTDGARIL
jgi:hypothetical protein